MVNTDKAMVTMNKRKLKKDLRALLFEPFRASLMFRQGKDRYADIPRDMVESITHRFLDGQSRVSFNVQGRIQDIIDHNVSGDPMLREPRRPYTPDRLKSMVKEIGMEAWRDLYTGRVEAEFIVQSSSVSFSQFRHPQNFSRTFYK